MRQSHFKSLSIICLGLVFFTSTTLFAQGWKPYDFKGDEAYEIRVETFDRGEKKTSYYSVDIRKTGEEDENGEELFDVTYSSQLKIRKSQLNAGISPNLLQSYGSSVTMALVNPLLNMAFSQMELKVGEKMSFYGLGFVEIPDKVNVAGREGFRCLFKRKNGEEVQMFSEVVIDPELALPLRTIVYDKGDPKTIVEIERYSG